MSATIAIDGLFAARVDDALVWRVRGDDPIMAASIEASLNREFGLSWERPFDDYVPDMPAAVAEAAADALGAEVIEIEPPRGDGANAIY